MNVVLGRLISWLPDLTVLAVACLAQAAVVAVMLRRPSARVRRVILLGGLAISWVVMTLGIALRSGRVTRHFHGDWTIWLRAAVFAWTLSSICWAIAYIVVGRLPGNNFSPARRRFFATARTALFAAPAATLGYGMFIERHDISLREHDIPVVGLPKDLNGLRLVQITDIHLSPFFSRKELDYAVAMANETRAHVALVTGDLITTPQDPLDDCLEGLKPLRADAGVFGCMGNHEIYARVEDYVEAAGARQGIRFLRADSQLLTFGDAKLNLAGVDYQRYHSLYLRGGEQLIAPDAYNVLLSHNPDVFDMAKRKGFDLTISGHTHGGQVRVEILGADLNVARFYTPYVDGLYRKGAASIFVARGLGTIGIPARLGAPPEVTLLRLCRS
jgi:predicted MPP superfamily phosphohydrolase